MSRPPTPNRLFYNDIKLKMLVCYASQFTEKIPALISDIQTDNDTDITKYTLVEPFSRNKVGEVFETARLFRYNSLREGQMLTRSQSDYEENRGE